MDYCESWESIATDDIRGFVHVIEEAPPVAHPAPNPATPEEPDLLFLGTEFGLYLSLDAGDSRIEWRHGILAAPVRGIVVRPRDLDLAVRTHGRGVYIVDDIRPPMAGRVRAPLRRLSSAMDAPSATDRLAMAQAEAALHELLAEFSRVMDGPLEAFRAAPAEADYTPLPPREPISGR